MKIYYLIETVGKQRFKKTFKEALALVQYFYEHGEKNIKL